MECLRDSLMSAGAESVFKEVEIAYKVYDEELNNGEA